jgi:hypothetical protein
VSARPTVVHWAGGVLTSEGHEYLRGWPCCCAGDRARAIASKDGRHTTAKSLVTCKTCLAVMEKDPVLR